MVYSASSEKVIEFMISCNYKYLDLVEDYKNISSVVNAYITNVNLNPKNPKLETTNFRIIWIISELFSLCEYLEDNINILKSLEVGTPVNKILFAFEDDYQSYLEYGVRIIDEMVFILETLEDFSKSKNNFCETLNILSLVKMLIKCFNKFNLNLKIDSLILQDLAK